MAVLLFICIPISVHLSSSLLIVCDQLLVNLSTVFHIGQRILLVAFPHHEQDHYDLKAEKKRVFRIYSADIQHSESKLLLVENEDINSKTKRQTAFTHLSFQINGSMTVKS